ncbi:MAG: hypothetical protein H0U12_09635 [Thermoleophilaceae bacterium]|nr:hypothetical protein [Thermoleophilaceae bacterium]
MNAQIDVGGVVRGVFDIYRDQASVLLPAALVVFVVVGVIAAVLVAISPILGILAVIAQLIGTAFFQGMVVQLVGDVQDGRRDTSVGDLFASVSPVVAALIGASLLQGLGIGVGFILLIVPGLFLLTIWAVVAPVVVLERPGVLPAFSRSRELVRGHGWQVLGVLAVFIVVLIVVSLIFGLIGGALGSVGAVIADIVSSVLTAPLLALAAAVLYFNLRAVKGEVAPPPGAVGLHTPAGSPGIAPESPGPQAAPPRAGTAATPGQQQPSSPPPGGGEPPQPRRP